MATKPRYIIGSAREYHKDLSDVIKGEKKITFKSCLRNTKRLFFYRRELLFGCFWSGSWLANTRRATKWEKQTWSACFVGRKPQVFQASVKPVCVKWGLNDLMYLEASFLDYSNVPNELRLV